MRNLQYKRAAGFSLRDLWNSMNGQSIWRQFLSASFVLTIILSATGCSLIFPPANDSNIRSRDAESTRVFGEEGAPLGQVAVVFLNRGTSLVQMITSVSYPDQPAIVWVTAVAPNSWDSIVLECGFDQVAVLRGIPVSLATGMEGDPTDVENPILVTGTDITCGALLVADINDPADADTGPSLDIALRTIPEEFDPDPKRQPQKSALAPGREADLLLMRTEALDGIPFTMTASWEADSGLVSVARLRLAGRGPGVASLIECPVERIGWGDVTDPEVAGATTPDDDTRGISAPAPLVLGSDYNCGDIVTFRAVRGEGVANRLELTTEVGGENFAEIPIGAYDLFGNIRTLLDEEGFAGRMSNAAALLPAPNQFNEGAK